MNDLKEQIERVYSKQYNKIGLVLPERGSGYQIELIRKFIPQNYYAKILDAGCGNGSYANIFQKSGYQNIYAVDLFEEISNQEIKYLRASIDLLPFENESFDFIYSLSVIYYLPSIEKALAELFRVLKPGAFLIITGHTKYSLFTLWRIVLRKLFNKKYEHLNGAKFISCTNYLKMAETIGFQKEYRDGFVLSFLISPIISIIRKHLKLAEKNRQESTSLNNNCIKSLKSEFAYHFVLVLKKPEA
jgi:SAM-dependent methyltransferase